MPPKKKQVKVNNENENVENKLEVPTNPSNPKGNELKMPPQTFNIAKNKRLDELLADDDDEPDAFPPTIDELKARNQEIQGENTLKENTLKDTTSKETTPKADNKTPENDKKPIAKNKVDPKAREALFQKKVVTYNGMYKMNIDAEDFSNRLSTAWKLIKSDDGKDNSDGRDMLNDLFTEVLKQAFEIEKKACYEEQRLPEYVEIIKSTNDLLRSAMFAVTDVYETKKKSAFEITAYGGVNSLKASTLTVGSDLWDMDQRSDKAWEIQSKPARDIADKWLNEDKPYQKMIDEMENLVKNNKSEIVDTKNVYDKLAAAEWLLLNNEKMMVVDPIDPINPTPNWENRYWKAIIQAREALHIPKYISIREMIQGNYAEMKNSVTNAVYNKKQFDERIFNSNERAINDSLEKQKEEYTIQAAGISVENEIKEQKEIEFKEDEIKKQLNIKECDQRLIDKSMPKSSRVETQVNKEKHIEIDK